MNRITQLAIESDLIEWDILPSGARTPDHESVVKARKFAELLVKECIKELENDTRCRIAGADKIVAKHFGVLE